MQRVSVFFCQRTQRSKARLKLLIALNVGLKVTGFERLYGRINLLESQNRKSSQFPIYYLRFRVERRSVKPCEARELHVLPTLPIP